MINYLRDENKEPCEWIDLGDLGNSRFIDNEIFNFDSFKLFFKLWLTKMDIYS